MPIAAASASESLALLWDASETERDLAALKDEKISDKKKEAKRKDILKYVAETRKLALSKAKDKPVAFQIHDGEMLAAANTPGKSVYELTATIDSPEIDSVARRGCTSDRGGRPTYSRGRLHRRPDRRLDNPAEWPPGEI